jgi:hypothetical protein
MTTFLPVGSTRHFAAITLRNLLPVSPHTVLRNLVLPLASLCLGLSSIVLAAAPVPVPRDAPMAVDRLRLGNPAVLSMTGSWRFKLDHGASPAVKGELPADAPVPDFAKPDAYDPSEAGWTNIPVPANWEIEGLSMLTYQDRTGNPSDGIGCTADWWKFRPPLPDSVFSGISTAFTTGPKFSSTASASVITKAVSQPLIWM